MSNQALALLSTKRPQLPPPAPQVKAQASTSAYERSPVQTEPPESASSTQSTAHPSTNTALERLIVGRAPDPSAIIPPEPDPPVVANDNEPIFKLLKLDSANDGPSVSRYVDIDQATGVVTAGVTSEESFIEFWAVEAWETASNIGTLFGKDLSAIETEEDEIDQGRRAAKHLYKLAHKYPRLLGWMLKESTIDGGDVLVCLAFFGGKGTALASAYSEGKKHRKRKSKDKIIDGEAVRLDD
ncbi:hypothetical protein [Kordiimonas sp.]|uniref:hypothetical protein n=1 Tax=Kordiimonas sp. TaxID=1970157 RepID=UPI003A91A82A